MDFFRSSHTLPALLIGLLAFLPVRAEEARFIYNINDYFEIHQDKRIYVFDDAATYKEFLASGETPFRLTRIGAGPNKETIVFGLRGMDKDKKEADLGGVNLYDGKADGIEESFYAEVNRDGRLFVFDDAKTFKEFRKTGEATFRYTEIGGGPKGETLVYVLTKKSADKKPDAQIEQFKALHSN